MLSLQNRFEHFLVAQQASGGSVELNRSKDEIAFLAFDTRIRRLVELHVLNKGHVMDAAPRRSALERIQQAQELRGLSFMRVLECGEENGVVYYSANLNDGEPVADYVARRGALPATTAFCLMQQYLEDLVAAKKCDRLLALMKVGAPLVTTHEDAFLQLRIVDYGLSGTEVINDEMRTRRVVAECGQLLFTLLTGQQYEGQNPDKFPALTCLPTNLRALLRTALLDPDNVSPVLEKLRDDIREAYGTLVTSIQARSSKKHLILSEALQPKSHVQALLLDGVPVADLLKGRYEMAGGEDLDRFPFSIPATHISDRTPVTVHLLPPSRIADKTQYDTVPLQMWRFNKDTHPNILRSLTLWETPDWTFLTEEREPGFSVSRLLAERSSLNPSEVSIILRQVCAGLDQANECGVSRVDIHPSNLHFKVGRDNSTQGRETERLMQKRLDAWPPFTLKVRTHATMRALYEPLLVEPAGHGASEASAFSVQNDFRNRSFVALAIYLLTGDRQVGGVPEFGETVPDTLAVYLKEVINAGKTLGHTPAPHVFLSQFEERMVPQSVEGRGFAAIRAAGETPAEEMESVGSVSDFDEDWGAGGEDGPNYLMDKKSRVALGMKSLPKEKSLSRGSMGMVVWALGAVILGSAAVFTLFGSGNDRKEGMAQQTAAPGATFETDSKPPEIRPMAQPPSKSASESSVSSTPGPKQPETIKKALMPTPLEIEQFRKTQGNALPVSQRHPGGKGSGQVAGAAEERP